MSRGEEGTVGRGRHISFCFNKNKKKGSTQIGKRLKKIIKFAVSVKWKDIFFYKYLTCSELINIMIMYARPDICLFTDVPHSLCSPFTDTLVTIDTASSKSNKQNIKQSTYSTNEPALKAKI